MTSTVQVLPDVVLSNAVVSAGLKGKNRRKNTRVTVASGAQFINVDWATTLREYELSTVPLRRADWAYIEELFEITDAGAFGFLMLDPKDQAAGVGEGIVYDLGGGTYQLYKRYTHKATGRYRDRKITRPIFAGSVLYVDGAPVDPGTGYVLDQSTGQLSAVPGSPAAGRITWTGRFYVPVHFQNDDIDWELVVPGADPDARFIAGPSVVFEEIRE
jgi:uncharacterized protein (TIGR02217 family)